MIPLYGFPRGTMGTRANLQIHLVPTLPRGNAYQALLTTEVTDPAVWVPTEDHGNQSKYSDPPRSHAPAWECRQRFTSPLR